MPTAPHRPWTGVFRRRTAVCRIEGQRAWGDGLCEQSLETALYPATWDTICSDELVFLMPSLMRPCPDPSNSACSRLASIVLEQIHDHVHRVALASQPSRAAVGDDWDPSPAARFIVSSGVLALSLRDLVAMDAPAAATGMPPLRGGTRAIVYQLALLAELDRFYRDAAALARDPKALFERPLEQVAVASIGARINGAYVYRQYASHHELLSACAWIGHVLSGRDALMPPLVADVLCDVLTTGVRTGPIADPTVQVIRCHAEQAGGAARLLACARRVVATDFPHPFSRRYGRDEARAYVWNGPLFDRLDAHVR